MIYVLCHYVITWFFVKHGNEHVTEMNTLFDKNEQERQTKQKQLEQLEQRAAESQKLRRDMDAITNRIKDDDDRIRELERNVSESEHMCCFYGEV